VLPSGPSVVAIRPIVGDPPRPSVGAVAVARPLDAATLSSGNADLRVGATGDGLEPPGRPWKAVRGPTGYAWAAAALVGDKWVTKAALPSADGRTALTIEVSQPDPWIGEGRLWLAVLVPVGLGVLTIGVGALVALFVSKSIGRPLRQFVRYMQEQGYLAIQGLRTDDELLIDPDLPADFRELGQVIVDLMTQLRVNQSELIEAGEQALTAERAFRTVVEESPEVKILVRQGVVEIANPAAAHFFGLHLGDLVRADPEGLFTGIGLYDEGGHRMDLATLAERATKGPVVARCTVPNQPDRWIEISVAVLDPVMLDYVISARNITEERRLEALREEILSLVSHDLRSPLTVVRGYLDILARPLDDERRDAAVESAKRAADRMEGLLDDLLHATRAERVFAPTVMRLVDMGELAEAVCASLQVGAEQQIRVGAEPGIIVLGDEVRLEQAVSNLVGNAIKHGPENGEIRVSVSSQGERARLAVEDDGPGLPEDQWETVFERGKRGPTSSGKPGLGLGLYIVRVVAEAHGGTAYIERSSTGGSRFVFELPLEQTDDRSPTARARAR
jgi:signal transduction histidine kinase